jgi:hypothetical protein
MFLAAKLHSFSVPSHCSAGFLIHFRWAQLKWLVFAFNSTCAFQKCALDFDFPGHG